MIGILISSLLVLSASSANAMSVECQAKVPNVAGNAIFAQFNSGRFAMDLETGEASLVAADNAFSKVLISKDVVSTFAAKRATCKPSFELQRGTDGTLKSFKITFASCESTVSGLPAYKAFVATSAAYNFLISRGVYNELFYDGNTKSAHFFLEACVQK